MREFDWRPVPSRVKSSENVLLANSYVGIAHSGPPTAGCVRLAAHQFMNSVPLFAVVVVNEHATIASVSLQAKNIFEAPF